MHKLVKLSAVERQRIMDDFVGEVFAGLPPFDHARVTEVAAGALEEGVASESAQGPGDLGWAA